MSLVARLSSGGDGQRKISAFFARAGVGVEALRTGAGGGPEVGRSDTPSLRASVSRGPDNEDNEDNMPAKRKNCVTAEREQPGPASKRKAIMNTSAKSDSTESIASAAESSTLPEISETSVGPKTSTGSKTCNGPTTSSSAGGASVGSGERLVSGTEAEQLRKDTNGLVVNIGASWFKALKAEFSKPYFQQLSKFVAEERKKHTVYPPEKDVFAWTTITPISEIRVVILGQDPYHGEGQAHGLCFSVAKGCKPLPPSLENMYKELGTDIVGFKAPGHGDLTGWAQQGVLLLNAVLTVRQKEPNSHKGKGWEKFTDAVVSWLNANSTGTVFILWGGYAQKKGACIDKKKHHVILGVHPSPLSAHRGFFGGKNFSTCNEYLRKQGKTAIDWTRFV